MKNGKTLKKTAILALSFAFALSGASCGSLISTNSEKDMKQVIGTVNIAEHEAFKGNGEYAAYADVIKNMNSQILKRDLIAYFLNTGYTYKENYGYTYAQTFNMLMDNLVSRKIMVQYAMVYYFNRDISSDAAADDGDKPYEYSITGYASYIETAKNDPSLSEGEKAHYEAHPEILTLKYFLTEGGEDATEYDRAVYTLKLMVNNTLDSYETSYIETDDDDSSTSASRTTPTGVGTENSDFYDPDYEIYTGYNGAGDCGDTYKPIDGSTQTSRRQAYGRFLASLSANSLILDEEDTTDFLNLDYYYVELASQLEQALITKYNDDLNAEADKALTQEYVEGKYKSLKNSQQNSYDEDQSAFETAIGSVSDTSFVLYSPKGEFGFVYNILLPFSSVQEQILSSYKNYTGLTKAQYYARRAALLDRVRGKDLRAPWFSSDEDSNYSFKVSDLTEAEKTALGEYYGKSEYLFFKDNLLNNTDSDEKARYEALGQYYGRYAYNGTVTQDEDGKYICTPASLSVYDFISEMEEYLTSSAVGLTVSGNHYCTEESPNAEGSYYVKNADDYAVDNKGDFDFGEFILYEGKVNLGTESGVKAHNDYFVKDTTAYKAVSAINELMFAYSTDTGCLNTYMGYTVSPYETSYMSEFEYAAQYAIRQGEGTYVVSPTDYGWHIIYVSFVYDKGDVYEFDWNERETEGTFSYLFYESLKSSSSGSNSYATLMQNQTLAAYNNDTCVTRYTKRYKDLLSLQDS